MKLSIIIPMYKVEPFIEKCLLSCESQDLNKDEYEIVCVNDGSPDESATIAQSIAERYENIRVIDRSNGGLSAARNTGLEYAKGEYIFFVDSDDWIKENCLIRIVSQLSMEKPDVLAICAANMYGDEAKRRFSYAGLKPTTGADALKYIACACAPFMIVRKALLDENNIRFWEGIYHEDSEYMPRMLYKAKKVSYTDEVFYYVYQNPNSITRTVNFKKVRDVLTLVAPHLYKFADSEVDKEHRSYFYDTICSNVNNVLRCNSPMSKKNETCANSIFYENRYLINAFKKSSLKRYRLEGLLLSVMPRKLCTVYMLLTYWLSWYKKNF